MNLARMGTETPQQLSEHWIDLKVRHQTILTPQAPTNGPQQEEWLVGSATAPRPPHREACESGSNVFGVHGTNKSPREDCSSEGQDGELSLCNLSPSVQALHLLTIQESTSLCQSQSGNRQIAPHPVRVQQGRCEIILLVPSPGCHPIPAGVGPASSPPRRRRRPAPQIPGRFLSYRSRSPPRSVPRRPQSGTRT